MVFGGTYFQDDVSVFLHIFKAMCNRIFNDWLQQKRQDLVIGRSKAFIHAKVIIDTGGIGCMQDEKPQGMRGSSQRHFRAERLCHK